MSISSQKLLIEIERSNSTTENFRFGFKRFLDLIGGDYRFKLLGEITEYDLNWCDVYIAVRPNTPMSLSVAKAIKESGRTYIVFFDDDLINRRDSIRWRNKSSKRCLELSDAVFGANPSLCEEYGRLSKYSFSVDTAVAEEELSYPLHKNAVIQFVYAAGGDHARIFESIVKPALKTIINEFHERIHFTFVGVEPRIQDLGFPDVFTFVPLMPLQDYTQFMRTHIFDIGLAPLEDDRFSSMKYFNKYIEYSKSGIAGIYSNVRPYTYVVHDGENGYLINNTDKNWEEGLRYCIENINSVRQVGLQAQNDLKKNYSLNHIVEKLQSNLNAVINDLPHSEIKWKNNVPMRDVFYLEDKVWKLMNRLRSRGISETAKIVFR